MFRLDVGDKLAGELDAFFIYLDTVVYLVEVQILSQGDEASLLTGEFHAHLCLLLAQFGEADACVDGATSINHLLCLEGEIIAEVGRFQTLGVAEVAVGHQGVSDVTEGEGCIEVGQFLAFSRFDTDAGSFYARFRGS